jgi:hypothetical protein
VTNTRKSLDRPDGTRVLPNRTDALVALGGGTIARSELRPGWRWSNDVRPLVGTTSCELAHTGYVLSGLLRIETDDGITLDLGPGDVFDVAPGHDAWVVGNEPCVLLDWAGAIMPAAPAAV